MDNSSEQAKNSRNTSDHMKIMGENITETTAEVQNLDQNATFMHSSSENASATLEKLCGINEQVEQMLAQVQQQTDRTNNSVQKIQQATTIISSIAEETNLLSLNASIEAAGREKAAADSLWWQVRLRNLQSNRISRVRKLSR